MQKIIHDPELNIEAYEFTGRIQPFPNHFHEHYVIGIVEQGARHLSCQNKSYNISPGSLIIFNPGDTHACTQKNSESFSYRARSSACSNR